MLPSLSLKFSAGTLYNLHGKSLSFFSSVQPFQGLRQSYVKVKNRWTALQGRLGTENPKGFSQSIWEQSRLCNGLSFFPHKKFIQWGKCHWPVIHSLTLGCGWTIWRPDSPFHNLKLDKSCCCEFSLRCQYPVLCHQRAVWWVCVPVMAIMFAAGLQKSGGSDGDLLGIYFLFGLWPRLAVYKDVRDEPSSGPLHLEVWFGTVSLTLLSLTLLWCSFTARSTQAACLSPKSALLTICEYCI